MDTSSLEGKGYVLTKGVGKIADRTTEIPNPEKLRALFKEVGLEKYTSAMDQLDQDILYRKTKERDLASVVKDYPKINAGQISKLKILISEKKYGIEK